VLSFRLEGSSLDLRMLSIGPGRSALDLSTLTFKLEHILYDTLMHAIL